MKKYFGIILKYFLLFTMALICIFPFLWILSTSLKGSEEIFVYPPVLIPEKINFENYSGIWQSIPFAKYYLNSFIVVLMTLFLNLTVSSMAGFALARLEFKGKNLLFLLVIAAMMIPKEIILIPVYIYTLKMGLADTLLGVVIPFAVEGFSIFLMRQAFLSIPKELEEAAILDGCSLTRLFFKISLPLVKPSLVTLIIFTFIGSWGDFLWPMIVLKSPENFTLQVGLTFMLGTFVNNFRYVASGTILALLPVLIVFMLSQKYFQRGIYSGIGK